MGHGGRALGTPQAHDGQAVEGGDGTRGSGAGLAWPAVRAGPIGRDSGSRSAARRRPRRLPGARLLSWRLAPLYAAALGLWLVARPGPLSGALAAPLLLAGLALRAWAAGHLLKTEELALRGPYAFMRHPLYAGSLLIGLGLGVAAGPGAALAVLALGLPAFLLYYLPYKERIESARLERRYGAAYARYRAEVPALWPRLGPWRPPPGSATPPAGSFRLQRLRANHEHGVWIGTAFGVSLLALRAALS